MTLCSVTGCSNITICSISSFVLTFHILTYNLKLDPARLDMPLLSLSLHPLSLYQSLLIINTTLYSTLSTGSTSRQHRHFDNADTDTTHDTTTGTTHDYNSVNNGRHPNKSDRPPVLHQLINTGLTSDFFFTSLPFPSVLWL